MGDLLTDIADVAGDLADARQHTERIPYWDTNRNRKFRTHVTVQPGLLAQLYECVYPAQAEGDGPRRPHPGSRPPLALEALSTHTVITLAAARWCWSLRIDQRHTVEGNLRALVGAAATLDEDTALTLLSEMHQWRRWAAVQTAWESPAFAPYAPCPHCGIRTSLRINLAVQLAYCRNCQAAWDDTTLLDLAAHIRTSTEEAA